MIKNAAGRAAPLTGSQSAGLTAAGRRPFMFRRRMTGVHRAEHAIRLSSAVLSLWVLVAPVASAVDLDEHRFAITPLIEYRSGGDFDALTGTANPNIEPDLSYGLALSLLASPGRRFELLYTFQPTEIEDTGVDLDVHHLHIGGTATYNEGATFIPYIAGGLGATRLSPSVGDDETRFSASLGLGLGLPVGERIELRFEVRGWFVSMDGNAAIFCGSGSAGEDCLVRAAGDTLFQYGLLAGFDIGL